MIGDIEYRVEVDNDLMQIVDGEEVGKMGLKLAPDTADLFAAAPELLDACLTALECTSHDSSCKIEHDGEKCTCWRGVISDAVAKAIGVENPTVKRFLENR